MKIALIVSGLRESLPLMNEVMTSGEWVCRQEASVADAIKALLGNRFDAVIVSSKIINRERINLLEFVAARYESMKVVLSLDNGMEGLSQLPDNTQIITPVEIEALRAL